MDNFYSYNGDKNYNYSFEICKVLDFNKTNKTVNVERNLLNYPVSSIFYGEGITYVAYRVDPNINLDLIFPISKVVENTIYFKFSAYFENEPVINDIYKNCQSRTALSARIIKGNIEIPNSQIFPDSNLFLMSSPEGNKVSSYLDSMVKINTSAGFYVYYINEFRSDNYLNNGSESIFEVGDVITITFPTGNTYNIPINNKKITYGLSLFDYYSASNIDITELGNTKTLYGVSYVNFTSTTQQTYFSPIDQTNNPYIGDLIKVNDNGTLKNIGPSNYTTQFYQNTDAQLGYIYYLNDFQNMFSRQKNLDKAFNMTKLTLKSTRLYNNINNLNSYIIIDNIVSNEKPYGPTYLNDLVSSNDLNLDGYGTIIKFDYSANYLHPQTIAADMIFKSRSGFVFSVASEIGSFEFNNKLRKSNNIPGNYNFSDTYDKNNLAYYKNNKKLLYSNTNNIVSKFNSTGKAGYDQSYYILDNGIYTYPLYLDSDSNTRVSVPYPSNTFYKLWYDIGLSINTSVKPSTNIYEEFTLSCISINSTWKQIPQGIFPIDNVTDFITNNFYEENSIIEYENDIWFAQSDNFNITPFIGSSIWSIYDNHNNLFNRAGYFYNINTGTSTVGVSLTLPSERDIVNYPISIIDYSGPSKYSLFTEIKDIVNYNDKLNGNGTSFLNLYDSLQTDILGKILLFKKDGSIISLAASPASKDEIDSYGFLKQMPLYQQGDILSQYVYSIALPPAEYMGKPFCTGNVPYDSSETVSDYEFTNSISFLTIPIDIDYQDYPFIIFDGTSIYDMPPNALYLTNGGISPINTIIKGTNGVYRRQSINFKRSSITGLNADNTTFNYEKGTASYINSGTDYIYNFVDSTEYYNLIGSNETVTDNITSSDKIFDTGKWDIVDTATGNIFASGIFNLEGASTSILNSSVIMEFNGNNLFVNVDENNIPSDFNNRLIVGNNLYVDQVTVKKIKSDLTLTGNTATKLDGIYSLTPTDASDNFGGSAYLVFDNQDFVPFNKIYIDTTGLTTGEKIYFLSQGVSDLKTKMYGFFENQYLSPIIYQGVSLIEDNNGIDLPCAIFSPFSNNLLSPDYRITLIDNDGYKVTTTEYDKEQFSDVINLGISDNGTSLTITNSTFKYPIFNVLDGSINPNNVAMIPSKSGKNIKLGIMNTNSVNKFISTDFYINDYITLGGISDVIPVDGTYDDKMQYYRETKGAVNYNTSSLLNCSIYQSDRLDDYPAGVIINTEIQPKPLSLFNIKSGINGTVYQSTSIPQIIVNTITEINQSDPSNNNYPIFIGISGGDKFADSVINDKHTFGTSSGVIIKYIYIR